MVPPTPITRGPVAGAETQVSEPRLPTEATVTTPSSKASRSASSTIGTRLPQAKLKLMLITSAPWRAAKRIPLAMSKALPKPLRSSTRTGISLAR